MIVPARKEDQRVARVDRIADQRGRERTGVVRHLLGDLGEDVPAHRSHLHRPAAPRPQPNDLVRRLRADVRARPGRLQQAPVDDEVAPQRSRPQHVRDGQEAEHVSMRRPVEEPRPNQQGTADRGDKLQHTRRDERGGDGHDPRSGCANGRGVDSRRRHSSNVRTPRPRR